MRDFLLYGPGIPRYVALWLPLAPVMALVVYGVSRSQDATGRTRRAWLALAALVASTLPTFLLHAPPEAVPRWLRSLALAAAVAVIGAWLVSEVRAAPGVSSRAVPASRAASDRGEELARPREVPPAAALAIVALALAVRLPLAWLDPGISQIPVTSETAVEQLLDGRNPYTQPNPASQIGTYQYPAGSILAHLPLVAAVPDVVAGEEHLGARATLWLTDVAVMLTMTLGAAWVGRPRAGLAAAAVYALHPTLVRESGMVVANDLIVSALVVGAAVAAARGRWLWAAGLVGAAISVKPVAVVVVPALVVMLGLRAGVVAVAVPAALQVPFLLWPTLGWHGISSIVEPVGRSDVEALHALSLWWPALAGSGDPGAVRAALTAVAIVAATAAAVWAGSKLRARRSLGATAAALSLPLLVVFALSTTPRHNYQGWYLSPFVLAAALAAVHEPPATARPGAA